MEILKKLLIKAIFTALILDAGLFLGYFSDPQKTSRGIINPSPTPAVKSEFIKSWVSPTYSPTLKPIPKPTLDTDPITTCISGDCGSKQMKRSECLRSTCCQLGSEWRWYPSREKCVEDQNKLAAQTRQPVRTNPPPVHTPYTPPLPTYTYSPVPLPSFEPLDDNWAAEFLEKAQKEANQMAEDYKKRLQEIAEFQPTDYVVDWSEFERLKEGLQPAATPTPHYGSYIGPRTYEQNQLWGNEQSQLWGN